MADTSSLTTLLQPYFNESATHISFSLTKQLRAHFKDKQVHPFAGIPLFEYLEKNKVAEHITMKWQDKVSSFQWNNPGYETGRGDLDEFVLCGLATVTHRGIGDFNVVKATKPRNDMLGYEFYFALVFGQETAESEVRAFLAKVARWDETRKNSSSRALWIFDSGDWSPDLNVLRSDIRSDLILEGQMQQHIEKDMIAFFASKERYNRLQVPWKRGLLFIGPPGNGKTRMIKILLEQAPVNRLYVKSIRSHYRSIEECIKLIFRKARDLQPCLLVLEDLDSLLGAPGSLSIFLNEIDGVQNTEGVLIIASSNHPERLDEAITHRPSRFDHTHKFDLPTHTLRVKFIRKWIRKLKDCSVPFTDDIDKFAEELAKSTDNFSFAFLEELFVSSLLVLARASDDLTAGEELLRQQVKLLRGQINLHKPGGGINRSEESRHWKIECRLNILIGLLALAVVGLSVLVGMAAKSTC